jgi:hypothetical protein
MKLNSICCVIFRTSAARQQQELESLRLLGPNGATLSIPLSPLAAAGNHEDAEETDMYTDVLYSLSLRCDTLTYCDTYMYVYRLLNM